jgi:hypothetical protein
MQSANSVGDLQPFSGHDDYTNWIGFRRGISGISALVIGFDRLQVFYKDGSGNHLFSLFKI